MPPSRLPSPSAILSEASLRSASIDDHAHYSIAINMTGTTPPPTSAQTQLPGFEELLDSLPESQRTIEHGSSPSSAPATPQPSWYMTMPTSLHGSRHDSRRTSWHPYSPPTYHRRSYSRSQSPSASDHSDDGPQPRTARPTYTEEEIYFIWYHRDDLQLPWPQILELFNMHFGVRHRNGVQGIQCRYYRALDIHGVPKSRGRDRSLPNEHYGVRHYMPDKHWTWMRN